MTFEIWVTVLMGVLGIGLTIALALVKILHNTMVSRIERLEEMLETRLRTLVHEDRDIRSQIQGVTKLFFESLRERDK